MVGLAHTIYRVRVVGRANVPAEGGALLVPNHVTFADGLFIITTSTGRFGSWSTTNTSTGRSSAGCCGR